MQQTISFILEVRLLGSLPHLSALPLEPPHSLLLPLGPHGGGGGGARTQALRRLRIRRVGDGRDDGGVGSSLLIYRGRVLAKAKTLVVMA